MAEKLSLVDMIGIGNLLEPLVAEDIITCEERDRIILRIAKDNEIDEYRLSVLAGYKRSKAEVLARMEQRKPVFVDIIVLRNPQYNSVSLLAGDDILSYEGLQ